MRTALEDTPPAPPAARGAAKRSDPNVQVLERDLSERLGTAVQIRHGARGGQLVIRYGNLDELDGILAHIK